jgi:PA domain
MNTDNLTALLMRGASAALGLVALVFSAAAFSAATIVILNINAPGEGFNDPTPVAPVGGNTGTTLGAQRLNAFQAAANIWGANLSSGITIVVRASFEPLPCTNGSAALASAGALNIWRDFANAPKPFTLYPQALANKYAGANLGNNVPNGLGQDVRARFNSNAGLPGCLEDSPFYLGLDNNFGSMVDFVTVVLHELAHGLGFETFTNTNTGAFFLGNEPVPVPSIWDHFLFDNSTNKFWINMTDTERAASARNPRKVVWAGANVTNAVPSVLSLGTPRLVVGGPAAGPAAGEYMVGTADFGAQPGAAPVTGQLMPVVDQANGAGLACTPLSAINALAVKNNIALVDRGTCTFETKALNVQNAGAIAMIVADNVAGSPPDGLGEDSTVSGVVIPSVRITQGDGAALKARLNRRSRTASGVVAELGVNMNQRAGADSQGRALMYTPDPFDDGSSVEHWDTLATPNQLMEPNISDDLTHQISPPKDMTLPLLQDIGW